MNDISKKLTAIEKSISEITGQMATKGDLRKMATKVDIKSVRGDMKSLESRLRGNMATKDDIRNMATKDDLKGMATKDDIKNMVTKDDLKGMASKTDLKKLEVRLLEKMDESQMEIIAAVDRHKADKETVEVLERRVTRLEDNANLPPYI